MRLCVSALPVLDPRPRRSVDAVSSHSVVARAYPHGLRADARSAQGFALLQLKALHLLLVVLTQVSQLLTLLTQPPHFRTEVLSAFWLQLTSSPSHAPCLQAALERPPAFGGLPRRRLGAAKAAAAGKGPLQCGGDEACAGRWRSCVPGAPFARVLRREPWLSSYNLARFRDQIPPLLMAFSGNEPLGKPSIRHGQRHGQIGFTGKNINYFNDTRLMQRVLFELTMAQRAVKHWRSAR